MGMIVSLVHKPFVYKDGLICVVIGLQRPREGVVSDLYRAKKIHHMRLELLEHLIDVFLKYTIMLF